MAKKMRRSLLIPFLIPLWTASTFASSCDETIRSLAPEIKLTDYIANFEGISVSVSHIKGVSYHSSLDRTYEYIDRSAFPKSELEIFVVFNGFHASVSVGNHLAEIKDNCHIGLETPKKSPYIGSGIIFHFHDLPPNALRYIENFDEQNLCTGFGCMHVASRQLGKALKRHSLRRISFTGFTRAVLNAYVVNPQPGIGKLSIYTSGPNMFDHYMELARETQKIEIRTPAIIFGGVGGAFGLGWFLSQLF